MNIVNNNTQINFRAKFKNPVQILTKDALGSYKPKVASFVEIENTNKNDIKALKNVCHYWGENDQYACNIYTTALERYYNPDWYDSFKIFAITKQKDKFEKLNDEHILGLAEVTEKKPRDFYISYIQVDPRNVYSITPEFKRVGTRILDSIKSMADRIVLSPNSRNTAKFYEENGFKPCQDTNGFWEWIRK